MPQSWQRPMTATTSAGPCRWTPPPPSPSTCCRSRERGASDHAEPDDHGLGRSRGGLSTKAHLASDSRARPPALRVTAGQADDAPAFAAVMAGIRVPRSGRGRPRTRPEAVPADRVLVVCGRSSGREPAQNADGTLRMFRSVPSSSGRWLGQRPYDPAYGSGLPVHGSSPCSSRRWYSLTVRKTAEPLPHNERSPSGHSSNSARSNRVRNPTMPQS